MPGYAPPPYRPPVMAAVTVPVAPAPMLYSAAYVDELRQALAALAAEVDKLRTSR